jgi:hypothetical protein
MMDAQCYPALIFLLIYFLSTVYFFAGRRHFHLHT